MRKRLLLSYVLLGVVVLALLEIPLGIVFARREHDNLRRGALQDAAALATIAGSSLEGHGGEDLGRLVTSYRTHGGREVAILDRSGRPLLPLSAAEQRLVAGQQPAIAAALSGRTVARTAHGLTGPVELVAQPANTDEGRPLGTVLVAVSAAAAEHRVHVMDASLVVLGLAVLAVIVLLAVLLGRSVAVPLADLERAAAALGAGDLEARALDRGPREVRTLARSFNTMAQRLDELLTSQRQFVGDVSHQLRSPLAALRLRLETVEPDNAPATRRQIDAAIDETVRMSRVVDGLLSLTRSEGARPARDTVDAVRTIRERAETWDALYSEREVSLDLDVPPGAVHALDVPGHLAQVLDNLLANALDASSTGTSVTLSCRSAARGRSAELLERPTVEVMVADRGHGMTAAECETAFTRHWQRDPHATSSGSAGLGLAISRRLARASSGDLLLRPREGGGLEAIVTIEAAG